MKLVELWQEGCDGGISNKPVLNSHKLPVANLLPSLYQVLLAIHMALNPHYPMWCSPVCVFASLLICPRRWSREKMGAFLCGSVHKIAHGYTPQNQTSNFLPFSRSKSCLPFISMWALSYTINYNSALSNSDCNSIIFLPGLHLPG